MTVPQKVAFVLRRTLHAVTNEPLLVIVLMLTTISRLIYFTLPAFCLAWALSNDSGAAAAVSSTKI